MLTKPFIPCREYAAWENLANLHRDAVHITLQTNAKNSLSAKRQPFSVISFFVEKLKKV